MVQFYIGRIEPVIEYPSHIFLAMGKEFITKCLNSEAGRDIIRGIDKSEVIGGRAIDSPILGIISPAELSGGSRSTLLALFCEKYKDNWYDGSVFGDNCYPYLLKYSGISGWDVKLRVGRVLHEPWEDTPVLLQPEGTVVNTFDECQHMLALRSDRFWRGEGYASKG